MRCAGSEIRGTDFRAILSRSFRICRGQLSTRPSGIPRFPKYILRSGGGIRAKYRTIQKSSFFKLKITAKQSRRSINKELIVSELLVANTAGIRSSKDRNKLELRKVSYKEGNAKQQISSVVRSCLNPL